MRRRLIIFILAAAAASFAQSPEQRADAMLSRMNLGEKIGQLTQLGGLPSVPDPVSIEERVRKGQAGSILWLSSLIVRLAVHRPGEVSVKFSVVRGAVAPWIASGLPITQEL